MLVLDGFTYHGIILSENGGFFEKLETPLPGGCAIYAFRQNGEWLYIGSASSGARVRLTSYLRRQRQGSDKPKHADIRQYLSVGPIEFWVMAIEPRIRVIDGIPIDFLLGVESGLIKTLHPKINRRERLRV